MLVAWVIPVAAFVFVVSASWQILRTQQEILTELRAIRGALERDRV